MPGRVESWTTMRATPSEEARMRGEGTGSEPHMWSYVPLERRIPSDHPLRPLRAMGDTILGELSPQFDQLHSKVGRPSIPPEHLLRALLLQVLYSVRSERLLMEQLDYNLLFRWFVGLAMDDPIWDTTVFTKNRERLLRGDIARAFFERVRAQADQRGLLSDEHFTVDGTLINAWASLKSFQRRDAPPPSSDDPSNPTVNFHGERRSNATHASTTDPQALLYRKGDRREATLCYQGHVLMENRHGLAVDGCLTAANGYGERAALEMVGPVAASRRITLAADKAYDTRRPTSSTEQSAAGPSGARSDRRCDILRCGHPARRVLFTRFFRSLLALLHAEVGAAVLRPAGLVVLGAERSLLTIAHQRQAVLGDALPDQIIDGGAGATLAEHQVVLVGAPLVTVALDEHQHVAVRSAPPRR